MDFGRKFILSVDNVGYAYYNIYITQIVFIITYIGCIAYIIDKEQR